MGLDVFDKGYNPLDIEEKWYEFWLENKFFRACEKSDKKSFSIVIPPPNVTGVLHMGHALNNVLQDILCRYKRLCNYNVLWVPGTDHAGIATQNVVEKDLAKNNITREQLGREKFIETVWQWREKSGGAIINQLKRLGASCDWDRERFTMDKGLSTAVRKVFVRLYKQGLIYEGNYIINWCPRCTTALADLEVEYEEQDSWLYYIRYPFIDEKNKSNLDDGLIVATTRPETMFGDTAVAVNPDDERFFDLEGKKVLLPLIKRIIPIIFDEHVDPLFGTGALKVTPAHDPNDFILGEKHGLSKPKVIDDQGKMLKGAGQFEGLDRFECREQAIIELEKQGLLIRKESLKNSVGNCYRCKTIIEPLISKQWFVKVKPLAQKAAKAVEDKKTNIIPSNWSKNYFEWLDNIKDWCISRQIWWGHRLPVWKCLECKQVIVEEIDPKKCSNCNCKDIVQETDVLDTWFSSALWPFSTLSWPDNTELLKTFYPTSVLVTGFDILFFWVARMMMMGLHFMDDVPFDNVYIHALVRDEKGKKMSKSTGNVIDPIQVIDKYGTDAFRFTLAAFAAQGRDVKMSESRVQGYRHFVNKLWNAARFVFMHIEDKNTKIDYKNLNFAEKWILSRTLHTCLAVKQGIEEYKFNEAASASYQFLWHEFCDWYLEIVKPALYGKHGEKDRLNAKAVLAKVLKDILIMLHPFMPFVTEEIYSLLPHVKGSIMESSFPYDEKEYKEYKNQIIETDMDFIFSLISGIRNVRTQMGVPLSVKIRVMAKIPLQNEQAKKEHDIILENQSIITNLAKLEDFIFCDDNNLPLAAATCVTGSTTCFIVFDSKLDSNKEIKRLKKAIDKNLEELFLVQKKLNNESFIKKAPEHIIQKVKAKSEKLEEKDSKLQANLERIQNT